MAICSASLGDAQSWLDQHDLEVQIKVGNDIVAAVREGVRKAQASAPPITIGGLVNGNARSAGPQTVNVNLPRGARHGDIARAMGVSTRRNGRRYGTASGSVSYARR